MPRATRAITGILRGLREIHAARARDRSRRLANVSRSELGAVVGFDRELRRVEVRDAAEVHGDGGLALRRDAARVRAHAARRAEEVVNLLVSELVVAHGVVAGNRFERAAFAER